MNQIELSFVHNEKENCHYDHISLNLKGIRIDGVCIQFNVNSVPHIKLKVGTGHREIKDRDRITSFPPCTTMSQKIDKEIRISLSMSSVFYPQSL